METGTDEDLLATMTGLHEETTTIDDLLTEGMMTGEAVQAVTAELPLLRAESTMIGTETIRLADPTTTETTGAAGTILPHLEDAARSRLLEKTTGD